MFVRRGSTNYGNYGKQFCPEALVSRKITRLSNSNFLGPEL